MKYILFPIFISPISLLVLSNATVTKYTSEKLSDTLGNDKIVFFLELAKFKEGKTIYIRILSKEYHTFSISYVNLKDDISYEKTKPKEIKENYSFFFQNSYKDYYTEYLFKIKKEKNSRYLAFTISKYYKSNLTKEIIFKNTKNGSIFPISMIIIIIIESIISLILIILIVLYCYIFLQIVYKKRINLSNYNGEKIKNNNQSKNNHLSEINYVNNFQNDVSNNLNMEDNVEQKSQKSPKEIIII